MRAEKSVTNHGILRPSALGKQFSLARFEPAEDLAYFIERHWIVRWDLRDHPPHEQETLPHPAVNVVIERGKSGVFGIPTRRFRVLLEGRGQVVATKLRPGAFYPFVRSPMTELRDRTLPLRAVFHDDARQLERTVLSLDEDAAQISLLEAAWRRHLPPKDDNVGLIGDIVRTILAEPEITKVELLVRARGDLSLRALQRMHEATERVANGKVVDWTKLALDLGYFDQAHFIRDFRAQIGMSPTEYAASCAGR
jgi:AraC-like DNA-binding protein